MGGTSLGSSLPFGSGSGGGDVGGLTGGVPLSGDSGSIPLSGSTPPPAATSSSIPVPTPMFFETPTMPLLTLLGSGQLDSDQLTDLINNLPQILQDLSPDDQTQFLQLLLGTDILDIMFGSLEDEVIRDGFKSLVDKTFDKGLLHEIVKDKGHLTEPAKEAIKEVLQQKFVQNLMQQKGTTSEMPTLTTTTPDAATSSSVLPQATSTQTAQPQATQAQTAQMAPQTPTTTQGASVATFAANAAVLANAATAAMVPTQGNVAAQGSTNIAQANIAAQNTTLPTTEGAVATTALAATIVGDSVLALNIPVSVAGVPNQMPVQLASLLAETITSALQQFVVQTNPTRVADPQTQAQTLLNSLLTLQLTSSRGPNVQVAVPTRTDAAGTQTQISQLTQQVNLLNQELTKLGQVVEQEKWDIGPLQNFLTTPPAVLALLKSVQPGDLATLNLLNTWVNNSDAIQMAILNRVAERFHEKFDFLKTIMFSAFAAASSEMMQEQKVRQQVFDQILTAAPALLNIFKLKDLIRGSQDNLSRKQAALLLKYKRMVFNAAREVVIVASGESTYQYNDVGIFHDLLPILSLKLQDLLPAAAEDMSFEVTETLVNEITYTFKLIKLEEPHRFKEILKRHPRTTLFFVSIGSEITEDYHFPSTSSLGEAPDSTTLNIHFERILNVVKKFEQQTEFLKYQPKVFEAFIDEARYDPTSQLTKTSLNLVHKAIADCSGFIDLDSPDE